MDDLDYRILISLAETHSLTRAAERHFLSQPTLTKRLRNIENELNAQLFLRTKAGLRLTPAGEKAVLAARDICVRIDTLQFELQQDRGIVCGTLSACVSLDYSRYVLPEVLARYTRRFPDVTLQMNTMRSRNCHQALLDGNCHIAIVRGDYAWDDERILLSRERVCLIRPKEHKDTPLSELRFICHKTDNRHMDQQTRWLIEHHLSPESTLYVDALSTCVRLTRKGIGWSIVPEICLLDFDGIREPLYFEDGTPLLRGTWLMFNKENLKLPQVNAFVETVKSCAALK